MKSLRHLTIGIAAALLLASVADGQQTGSPLNLQLAVTIALEKNPLRKAAMAETRATSANIKAAQSFLLPHIGFSETATRGNDPVYVFGSRLRQQRFTEADFALSALNRPTPFGNFSTKFGGTWNVFDSFASWHGVTRARLINDAANHQLARADQEIVFRVIQSYSEVLLAAKQLDVAEQSVKTAQAIVDRSQVRFDSGLVVESDLLTAKVRLASRQQESIRARNNHEFALAQLNAAMGVPFSSSFELTQSLAERQLPAPQLDELEMRALSNRPDLKRVGSEVAAQQQGVSIAKSAYGPQVNAFAGWEMDNPTFLAGGGGNNWVAGVELKFDIFEGGARRAEVSRQRALQEKATAMQQAASDAVRLEVRRAYYDMNSIRQQIEVARAAVAQAQDSLRISQDRYETGLVTITDLLTTEDAARRTQTDYWEAVSRFQTSYANLELATGKLDSQSPVVMP